MKKLTITPERLAALLMKKEMLVQIGLQAIQLRHRVNVELDTITRQIADFTPEQNARLDRALACKCPANN